MKIYQCHKRVTAAKIVDITERYFLASMPQKDVATLRFADGSGVKVDDAYLKKHRPEIGGYYVVYEDGYQSFSPAMAFESGYAEVSNG